MIGVSIEYNRRNKKYYHSFPDYFLISESISRNQHSFFETTAPRITSQWAYVRNGFKNTFWRFVNQSFKYKVPYTQMLGWCFWAPTKSRKRLMKDRWRNIPEELSLYLHPWYYPGGNFSVKTQLLMTDTRWDANGVHPFLTTAAQSLINDA